MIDNWLERTELLLGNEKLDMLRRAHVLVVGVGGSYAHTASTVSEDVFHVTLAVKDLSASGKIGS